MERIHSAVLTVCMMSAAVGLVSLICRGKALARQIRFLFSLLFVVGLAAPFAGADPTEFLDLLSTQGSGVQEEFLTETAKETLLHETKAKLQQILTETLAQHGIHCDVLEADVHIGEDGRIHISKVTAECDDFAGANALLSDLLGEEAEICVTQVLTDEGSP